jgi:hypothetical protein
MRLWVERHGVAVVAADAHSLRDWRLQANDALGVVPSVTGGPRRRDANAGRCPAPQAGPCPRNPVRAALRTGRNVTLCNYGLRGNPATRGMRGRWLSDRGPPSEQPAERGDA